MVKDLPAVPETLVWSLGWEDPLAKQMAIHSSILAWRIRWTEKPGKLPSMESQRVGHDWENNTLGLGTRNMKLQHLQGMLEEQWENFLFSWIEHLMKYNVALDKIDRNYSCWLEKAKAAHSSILAWKIPRTEEPGRLQSMGSMRVGQTEQLHFHTLEKEMATHSSVLAWRISGTAEPGGLPSMGSHRVGHDWSDLAAAAAFLLLKL